MMFGSPGGISWGQFFNMLPEPKTQAERRRHLAVHEAGHEACGCCPICQSFVHVRFDQPGNLAACPQCGGLIEALNAIGTTA